MGKVQRLSHQQVKQAIKRNELRDFLEDALEWTRSHVENVIIGTVLLAALAFGFYYLMSNRAATSVKASVQMTAADNLFERAVANPNTQAFASARVAYQGVKDEFSGKPESLRAELGLANVDFEEGKFEEAQAGYERFVAAHASDELACVALAGQAASLESLNKPADAAEMYLAVTKKYPQASNAAQCLMDAARIFEAQGQKAKLKEVVSALEALQSASRLPDSFKTRLNLLKAKAA